MVQVLSPLSSPVGTQLRINIIGNVGGVIQCEIVDIPVGGSPSQGTNNYNVSDGSGGWVTSGWATVTGDELFFAGAGPAKIQSSAALFIEAPVIDIASTNDSMVKLFNYQGTYLNTTILEEYNVTSLARLVTSGGAAVGDELDLQIGGIGFPSLVTPSAAQYLRMPQAAGAVGTVMTQAAGGQLEMQPAPAGVSTAVSSFQLSLAESSQTILNDDMPMVFQYVSHAMTFLSMTCFLTQSGAAGDVFMAIYEVPPGLSATRLAVTVAGSATGSTGPLNIALAAPLVVSAGTSLYFALYSRSNGASYLEVNSRWNGAGPLIAPKPTFVGAMPPANVNIVNGQMTRPWIAGLSI